MKIDMLRLFTEVADRLNFADIAGMRQVNASSVSRTIAQLEATLGVRLFQRTTRHMALTEAGALFLDHAKSILAAYDKALEDVGEARVEPKGRLRLTASVAFGERMVMPHMPDFRKLYPDIVLDLRFTDRTLDLVSEGIDLGIRLGPRLEGDFISTRLRPTKYYVCASPDYVKRFQPLTHPQDLTSHACICFPFTGFREQWRFKRIEDDSATSVSITPGMTISSALGVYQAIYQGIGPGLLADWMVEDDLASGKLVNLFPTYSVTATEFETSAWLIYPSRRYLPKRVRVMIEFLKSRIGKRD